LSVAKLVRVLGLEVTVDAVERWENNQNRPLPQYRERIVEFLGYDPAKLNSTGES